MAVVSERLMSVLFRVAFAFEPLAPQAISYFLRRTLRDWKRQGLISDYGTRTKRLGKFHYRIEADLEVNEKQVHYILGHLLVRRFKTLRRWFNDGRKEG